MDILTELRTTVLNDSGQNLFWSDNQLLNALNAAQIWVRGEASDDTLGVSVQVVPASKLTNDLQSLVPLVQIPQEIMVPQLLVGPKGEAYISSLADMERYSKYWRNTPPGEPITFIFQGLRQLRPYPLPDQEYSYDLWGLRWPSKLTATTLDLDVIDHNYYHAVLMNSATRLLLPTQPNAATLLQKEAEEHLNLYRRHLRSRGGTYTSVGRLTPKNTAQPNWTARLGSTRIAWRA
jgi:hypothetical protein